MLFTNVGDTPAKPMSRSTAIGGHVDIRSVGRISGCLRKRAGLMSVRFPVAKSAASTSLVVWIRVERKAVGANCINQSLYISTDWAISSFHFRGLLRLIGI